MAAMDTSDDPPTLESALAAARELFADAPTAADAPAWASARGMVAGDDLAEFVLGEARCERLARAKAYRSGAGERSLVEARAKALAWELGAGPEDRRDAAGALAFAAKVVAERGAAAGADPTPITPQQRATLDAIHTALREDFSLRRRMLLTRCDVTMQGFLYGDGAQGRQEEVVAAVAARREALGGDPPPYAVDDALATSHARAREVAAALGTPSAGPDADGKQLRALLVGAVPDRGGNVRKTRPGKKDLMPEWADRKEGGGKGKGGRGRGRGGGGRGRGGGGGGKGGEGKKKKGGGRGGGGKGKKPKKAA